MPSHIGASGASNAAKYAFLTQGILDLREASGRLRAMPAEVMFDIAKRAVQAPWWPRGVGLLVDHGIRCEFEPPGGVRSWINVRRVAERQIHGYTQAWSSSRGNTWRSAGVDEGGHAFCEALLAELSHEVNGLSGKAALALPVDANELMASLGAVDPESGPKDRHPRKRLLPTPATFTAGESLTRRLDILQTGKGSAADVQLIKGEVAARLGAALLERFEWRRPVVLEKDAFDEMARQLDLKYPVAKEGERVKPAPAPAWRLQVGANGGDVDLILHDKAGDHAVGPVLKSGPHVQGAYVFRPDEKDDMIDSWKLAGAMYNGQARPRGRFMMPTGASTDPDGAALKDIDLKGRVIVEGHGGLLLVPGRQPYARTAGGLSPSSLARALVGEGLPKGFEGTIYLNGCGCGGSPGDTSTYAFRFQRALARNGIAGATVAASPGLSRGVHRQKQALPDHLVCGTARTIRASKALIRNLERQAQAKDASDEERKICSELITEEQKHIERVQALNAVPPATAGGSGRVPLLGKCRRAWEVFKSALGLRHVGLDERTDESALKRRAWVRSPWGHIGPAPRRR
ncbi:hypothetical protein CDL60_06565 [Roseateles noduli]|nr:hypothetical protein CDL60_06565 [Roseateles noduli]